jgi:hypothetical protein
VTANVAIIVAGFMTAYSHVLSYRIANNGRIYRHMSNPRLRPTVERREHEWCE